MNRILNKINNFIKEPHFPFFLLSLIRKISPTLARFLLYGRYNPNTETYWNKRYKSGGYEEEKYEPLRREILKLVPIKSKVLDAGCGTGTFMEMLRDQRLCSCTGVDISEVSIKIVKEKGFPGFKCKLPSLPEDLKENSFDVCTIIETLEHLSRPQETLRSLYRVLKEGGYLIAAVPDDSMKPEEFDEHVAVFNAQSLQDLIGKYFKVDTLRSVESFGHHYLVVRAKKVFSSNSEKRI
jgi:ubiquinone/menaquinone biosynthesis C-methylase UbiE